MNKQIQQSHPHLYRPFPGQQICLQPRDHLKINSKCLCKICDNSRQKPNPQIFIDQPYDILKTQKSKMISQNSMTLTAGMNLKKNKIDIKHSSIIMKDDSIIQQFDWYLKHLVNNCKTLPNYQILDTMVIDKGQLSFYIFTENNKTKVHINSNGNTFNLAFPTNKAIEFHSYSSNQLKLKLLQKKSSNDIDYQKAMYKQEHPEFQWAQLDHQSEKLIKQFQKKIKFTDQMLNRVAIIQQISFPAEYYRLTQSQQYRFKDSLMSMSSSLNPIQNEQKVLSKYQFINLFDKTRVKVCQLENLEYIQLFPIMYGEQQKSYTKQIKYFRSKETGKHLYKEAQQYVLAWLEKNESLQKMQQQWINQYFYQKENTKPNTMYPRTATRRLIQQKEQQLLLYQSYKLMLHFQAQTNLQIQQCLLQFFTVNSGASFYLKCIKYIKSFTKATVQVKQNKLPKYKPIDKQDYIQDLRTQMKETFQKVQHQYSRLSNDYDIFDFKWKDDMRESDRIFKAVRGYQEGQLQRTHKIYRKKDEWQKTEQGQDINQDSLNSITLHKILKSPDQQYKEQMLGLNLPPKKIQSKILKTNGSGIYNESMISRKYTKY